MFSFCLFYLAIFCLVCSETWYIHPSSSWYHFIYLFYFLCTEIQFLIYTCVCEYIYIYIYNLFIIIFFIIFLSACPLRGSKVIRQHLTVILSRTLNIRDAPIAIFLADSDFQFFGSVTCRYRFLAIPILFLRTIIDSIYKQKSMQISMQKLFT